MYFKKSTNSGTEGTESLIFLFVCFNSQTFEGQWGGLIVTSNIRKVSSGSQCPSLVISLSFANDCEDKVFSSLYYTVEAKLGQMPGPGPYRRSWLSWAEIQTWEWSDVFPCGVDLFSVVRIGEQHHTLLVFPQFCCSGLSNPGILPASVSVLHCIRKVPVFLWSRDIWKHGAGLVNQIHQLASSKKVAREGDAVEVTFHQW